MSITREIKDIRDQFNRGTRPDAFSKGINAILEKIDPRYHDDLLKVRDVMNRDINSVIRDIENSQPGEKHILPKEYRFPTQKKLVCPILVPGMGLIKTIKDDELEAFADKMAELRIGNAVRMFSTAGWEPHFFTGNKVIFPYLKQVDKFNTSLFNPEHMEWLKRRIGYFTSRKITVILDMLDNCQLHTKKDGFWNMNWWNGDNNINGTSNRKPAMTHWYEDQHQDKPGYKETGAYLMRFYRRLWENLEAEFRPFIVWGCGNEIDARVDYHQMMAGFAEEYDIPKARRFTSMKHDNFYSSSVHQYWNLSLHGCADFETYKERKALLVPHGVSVLAAGDGPSPPVSLKDTEDFAYLTLNDGALGCEFNFRPYFEWKDGKWIEVGGHEDWNLMNLNWDFLKAVGKGWHKWMNA